MLLNLENLVEKYQMNIEGIIHVGASEGQEIPVYQKLGIKKVVFFEPLYDVFKKLEMNAKPFNYLCYNYALSDREGITKIYREHSNGGQSSSLLKPNLHEKYYPDIVFDSTELINTKKLDSFNFYEYNMLNIDVQGAESMVLRGSIKTLPNIKYIYLELNFEELYKGCSLVNSIDEMLSIFDFKRVETGQITNGWTDGLYIKQKLY